MATPMDYARWSAGERLAIVLSLTGATALCWLYLVSLKPMSLGGGGTASASLLLTFAMWSIMMVGMMIPSALPMVLTFVDLNGRERAVPQRLLRIGAFVLAYVVVWVGYSAAAAMAQFFLHTLGLASEVIDSPTFSGIVLVGAGAFQWSSLKYRCLERCRTPMGFLMTEWRSGIGGSFSMGLRHGTNCLGCCWGLMALMFVVGAMNLLWMALLSVFCWVEKAAPGGPVFGRLAGLALVVWGSFVLCGTSF